MSRGGRDDTRLAADGSLILVGPGLYEGRVRLRGSFAAGVSVCADPPYQTQLRHDDTVVTAYTAASGCDGITLEGFDIAHSGPGAGALVVHLDADGDGAVHHRTLRNNVIHDSYDNDVLKINNVWSDPTGTMGALDPGDGDDFSDTDPADTMSFVLSHNLYFNGADPIPHDAAELIDPAADPAGVPGTIRRSPLVPRRGRT